MMDIGAQASQRTASQPSRIQPAPCTLSSAPLLGPQSLSHPGQQRPARIVRKVTTVVIKVWRPREGAHRRLLRRCSSCARLLTILDSLRWKNLATGCALCSSADDGCLVLAPFYAVGWPVSPTPPPLRSQLVHISHFQPSFCPHALAAAIVSDARPFGSRQH